jgi:hypothetical protein
MSSVCDRPDVLGPLWSKVCTLSHKGCLMRTGAKGAGWDVELDGTKTDSGMLTRGPVACAVLASRIAPSSPGGGGGTRLDRGLSCSKFTEAKQHELAWKRSWPVSD